MQAHVSTQTRLIIFFSIMSSLPLKKFSTVIYEDKHKCFQLASFENSSRFEYRQAASECGARSSRKSLLSRSLIAQR